MFTSIHRLARLPEQLIDGMQATVETAQLLPSLQRVVTDRLGSLDGGLRDVVASLPTIAGDLERVRVTVEPLNDRVAAIESGLVILPVVADDLERVRATVEPQQERVAAIEQTVARLESRLTDLHAVLALLKTDVNDATELLPDPDAQGPLARARVTLAGRT